MATYSRRELHITRVEFHVPAEPPWGAPWAEVLKAAAAAAAEIREARGLDRDAPLGDDEISVAPHDEDAVVVSYELRTTEEEPRPTLAGTIERLAATLYGWFGADSRRWDELPEEPEGLARRSARDYWRGRARSLLGLGVTVPPASDPDIPTDTQETSSDA